MTHVIRIFLLFVCCCLHFNRLRAQDCGCTDCDIPVVANLERVFTMDVSGAVHNTLGLDNFVCGVEIDVAHDFISDLDITLISPSGKSAKLIASDAGADTTWGTRWTLKLAPCWSLNIIPDAGYQPEFSQNMNWPIQGQLNGTYYPYEVDCFDKFNDGGPVNGQWKLRVGSTGFRGTGFIYNFKLEFCTPDPGITCNGLNYPVTGGEDCQHAAALPINLSNFIGNTAPYHANTPPTDFCGVVENDQWFMFTATCSTTLIKITPGYCINANGLQVALYDNCSGLPLDCVEGCADCNWAPMYLSAITEVGKTYYILIDGWEGDQCDFIMSVIGCGQCDAPDLPPSIIKGCEGDQFTLQLNGIPFGASGYIWQAGSGATINGQAQSTVYGPGNTSATLTLGPGNGQVCVAAFNYTDVSDFVCIPFESLPELKLAEYGQICPFDSYISTYAQYGVPPIYGPGTYTFELHGYPGDDGQPYPCKVVLTLTVEQLWGGLVNDFPQVGLNHFFLPDGEEVFNTGIYYWYTINEYGCEVTHQLPVYIIKSKLVSDGCMPDTVTFTMPGNNIGLSCPGGSPDNILPFTSGNVNVIYWHPGIYDLTATRGNAEYHFFDAVQLSGQHPIAGPSFTITQVQNTVTFNNFSQNADSYSWDFGDGNSSTDTQPQHTYTAPGTYLVRLDAGNICGVQSYTQIITITGSTPQAAFTSVNPTGCAPLTVQFSDVSNGNPDTWNWSFPGGLPDTSTAQHPVVTYNTPGTYPVHLSVGNVFGTSSSVQSGFVTVLPPTKAGFQQQVVNDTVLLTDNSLAATQLQWNFGDGTVLVGAQASHVYAVPGTYTITQIATGICNSDTLTQSVQIITTQPHAAFNAVITSGCAPLTVQFEDLSIGNPGAWSWSFPGGSPSTANVAHPMVVYDTPGVYPVSLHVQNAAGQDTALQAGYITVLPATVADIVPTWVADTLHVQSNSVNATQLFWDFGDGSTSTEAAPAHHYTAPGDYTLTLIAVGVCNSDTATYPVHIQAPPLAAFSALPAQGCVPLIVQYQDLSSGDPTHWQWTFPGGTPEQSADQNPVVVYLTPGVFDAYLTASNDAGESSFSLVALVQTEPLPVVAFAFSQNGMEAVLENQSVGANSYMWEFGDGSSSTDASPSHTFTAPGQYLITLHAFNTCGESILQQWITVESTDTKTVFDGIGIRLMPNPSNGIFELEISGLPDGALRLQLLDATGSCILVKNDAVFGGLYKNVFDISRQPSGVYLLEIASGTARFFRKLVIQPE